MRDDVYWLERLMPIDHVISVSEDGQISDGPADVHAPESVIETADDDAGSILAHHEAAWVASLESQGWHVESGWSGQYGYAGPIMHASEFIGGRLADHIADTPGLWVAVSVETLDDSDQPAGWAVCHRELP